MEDDEMWRRAREAQLALFGGAGPMSLEQVQQLVAYVLISATWDSGCMADEIIDPLAARFKHVWPIVEAYNPDSDARAPFVH